MFFEAFKPVITAIAGLFTISLISYILVKRKKIGEKTIVELTRVLVDISLPCLLFVKVMKSFSLEIFKSSLLLIASGPVIIFLGLLISLLLFKIFRTDRSRKWEFVAIASLANTGYLPISLIASLLPAQDRDLAILYVALFLILYSPILWTFGVWAMTRVKHFDGVCEPSENRPFLSGPFIGIIIGIIFCIPPLKYFANTYLKFALNAAELVGEMSIPLSMFLLGGILASIAIKGPVAHKRANSIIILTRLFIVPAIMLFILYHLKLPYLLGFIIMIEAAMPSAINLTIMARRWCGDYAFAAKTVSFTYIFSLISVPLYIALYNYLLQTK